MLINFIIGTSIYCGIVSEWVYRFDIISTKYKYVHRIKFKLRINRLVLCALSRTRSGGSDAFRGGNKWDIFQAKVKYFYIYFIFTNC